MDDFPRPKEGVVDKLAWLYIKDRKVIMTRSRGEKLFFNVGGKREDDETDEEALVREVREETGVDLKPQTIAFLAFFEDKTPDGRPMTSTCYWADFDGIPEPSSEIEEIDYFTSADGHRTTSMGRQILAWLKEKKMID